MTSSLFENAWSVSKPPGVEYGQYIDAARRLQDAIVSLDARSPDLAEATAKLLELARELEGCASYRESYVDVELQPLTNSQGPMSVPIRVIEARKGYTKARVRFHRYHHGANGAAHGGAEALLFDEVLGRMSNYPGEPRSRTAFLHVNYRAIAPIEKDLVVEATVDRVEGRKKFSTGRIYDGDTLVADAEALFVILKPGQP